MKTKSQVWKGVAEKIASLDEILEECDHACRDLEEAKATTGRLEELVAALKLNEMASLRELISRKVKVVGQCQL